MVGADVVGEGVVGACVVSGACVVVGACVVGAGVVGASVVGTTSSVSKINSEASKLGPFPDPMMRAVPSTVSLALWIRIVCGYAAAHS